MGESSSDRRGRWVYQNLRWHFLPHDDEPTGAAVGTEPEPALSSLVDTRRLTEPVSRWADVSGLRAAVYAVEGDASLKMLYPEQIPESADPGTSTWKDFEEVALRCLRDDQLIDPAQAGDSKASVLAVPVRLEWRGAARSRIKLVVVANLPEGSTRAAFRNQLIEAVDLYGAWLAQALDQREELARLRALNRTLMVRVEAVEKRLLKSCSEPMVRMDEAGTVLEDQILSQILALPALGIVVERCSDHRILYMNANMKRRYGDCVGERCFEIFRERSEPCARETCPMVVLFEEGAPPMTVHLAYDIARDLHYEVFAIPLIGRDGSQQVLEVGVDVTRLVQGSSASDEASEGESETGSAK